MKLHTLAILMLCVSGSAFAADFTGSYKCTGSDPYLHENYGGTVVITKDNDVYQLEMDYTTGEKSTGTAIEHGDNTLFVTFQDKENSKNIGLQQYTKDGNDKMSGNWVYLGHNKIGKESCEKLT
jgi:hypothetical protein